MSRKDYVALADIVGRTLGIAYILGGEVNRTAVYDELYRPLVARLQADNPRFDNLRFAQAVGTAEAAYVGQES